MFETVVLALDGSKEADAAIPVATALAKQAQGKVVVLHVQQRMAARGGVEPVHVEEAELTEQVRQQAEAIAADGVETEFRTEADLIGGPAPKIAEIAAEIGADVIVLGSRGNSALAGVLLGSVAHKLLHVAGRPVLVVPGR